MNEKLSKKILETIPPNKYGCKVIIRKGNKDYKEDTKEFVAKVLEERLKGVQV